MVPKPMSSMNAFKNIIGTNRQSQSDKNFNLDSPTGDRQRYHGDSNAARMSPALKRSLLDDLKPMMRKMGSSRSLVSLTSQNNNNVAHSSMDDIRARQPADASPRRLSKGTTKSTPTIENDYGPQQPSHRKASIKTAAGRAQDAIRRASSRSMESTTCRQNNRSELLTKQDSAKSLNSLKSVHSFQQDSLDEGDGGNQLRGILLARKAELSASRSDLRIPSPLFSQDHDNDDAVSVLSEGDSSIAESLGNTPLNSPQPSKPPIASTGIADFEQIEKEKEELQRMIAQLELETREMEQQIARTKSQNDLLRNYNDDPIQKEPPMGYKPPQKEYHQQQPEYKRFVQPSAALKIMESPESTKKTPVRARPPLDSRQIAGLLAQLESDVPHIAGAEGNHVKVDKYAESPASSIALLEARVHQLTVSPQPRKSLPPNASISNGDYDSETDSHAESHSSDYTSNTGPSSSDELDRSQTSQQKPQTVQRRPRVDFQQPSRLDSFEHDAGDWLIEQIARGNESLSQVSSQPPTIAGPTPATYPMAGINPAPDDASLYSDSTWTFYTMKTNKTASTRSVMTASNYLPKWTAPPTRPPSSYEEMRQYQNSAASSMASSVHSQSDYYPGHAMQRVPATPRLVKSDPPERGRPQEVDSPTSTLESSLNPDPPVDTNQATAPFRIQPTIPEEEYLEPDTTLPTIISFSSFEKFEDDEVSAISAKGRKVERTSKSSISPPPESVSTHMDHENASMGNSDSSSELSDVGLMLQEIEDNNQLYKQLQDSTLFHLDPEPSDRSRSRSNKSNPARTTNRRSKSTDDEKTKKKKKLLNARELLERSKLSSKRKGKNENDDTEHEPPKPLSALSLDTKRSSSTKSPKTKRAKSSERTKSRSPRPTRAKDLEEVPFAKRSEQTKSRSPRPSKADLEAVPVVKDKMRSKSKDRGIERAKSDKSKEVSKSPSRSKSTERLTQKFSSSRSIESNKSKSSKATRAKSLSPVPAKTKKDDQLRLRSKSNERSIGTNIVAKKEKVVSRGIDKAKSIDNAERVARAAKVLERARSSRRDSFEELTVKCKRASSKEDVAIKSRRERSSSKEKKRTKSKEGSSRKGTRRSAVLETSNHSHARSLSSERSRQKESSKSSRKSLKSASNSQSTTMKRPKSTESLGLRAKSKRNDSMLESKSLHNDRFFSEIPKARSDDDLAASALTGNKTSAMSKYFERSRKKDYLSYTIH